MSVTARVSSSCGHPDETGVLPQEVLDGQPTGTAPTSTNCPLLAQYVHSQRVCRFIFQCAALDGKCSISCDDEVSDLAQSSLRGGVVRVVITALTLCFVTEYQLLPH